MRVSKTVREYIEKRVTASVSKKYEQEASQRQYEMAVKDEVLCDAANAAKAAWEKVLKDALIAYSFLVLGKTFNGERIIPSFYHTNALSFGDIGQNTSVHNYLQRRNKEIKDKVESIIVELELGGTKADLERLLAEIEEEK